MQKNIVKNKILTSADTKDSSAHNGLSNFGINEAIQVAPLIDPEEEKF